MNRPRIPLGLESARAALNHEACTRLGRLFADARAQRGIDVRNAAARLLLSPRQVVGLETADGDAFYSAELYQVAARKYDALLGLASPLVDEILVPPVLDTQAPVTPVAVTRRSPVRLAAAASLAAAVTLAVGGWLVLRGIPVTDAPVAKDAAPAVVAPADMPTLQNLVSTQLSPAPVAVRLSAPEEPSPVRSGDGEFGYVRVPETTWVFVRYADNSTVERVISPADRFVLRAQPVYLAVGRAPGAEVVLVGEPIDTGRFVVDGQLRIGSAFLSAAARQ